MKTETSTNCVNESKRVLVDEVMTLAKAANEYRMRRYRGVVVKEGGETLQHVLLKDTRTVLCACFTQSFCEEFHSL
ncbi:unnamed protein product [Toxocara canis]|uniref:Phosphoribosylaminoimidazolesuccinocarboxamide synthase n=1 Tax=Toxocara canis TaxID=6265 RepID=A0A183TZW5_TOXCA|nr:unnamed protein product [Toxocara canis]